MEILEQYILELEKDIKIDEFTVREVQMKLPAYKHKWVGRLMRHKLELNQLYGKKSQLLKKLVKKVQETSTYNVAEPTAKKALENHETIMSLNTEIDQMKLLVEFLEKSERILSSMTFDVKNLVEIMKLETT